MKICISATGNSLDATVDPRFGRASYFIVVDSDTMDFETVVNSAVGAMHGAGIQAAQTIANKGVKVVITGNVGPNAFKALNSAGIKIVVGAYGTVRESLEKYKKGELKETTVPTAGGHSGIGRGAGMGRKR